MTVIEYQLNLCSNQYAVEICACIILNIRFLAVDNHNSVC